MKRINRLAILLLAMVVVTALQAQQLPQLTQYQFNDYVYNPAFAGSRPSFELRSAHRYQWVGLQDAPRTFMLSATSQVGTNMGVGGYLFTDHVGPTRRTGIQFSYAYHLQLNDDLRLSFALSGGLLQFLIDGSKIQLHDPGDPVMDQQLRGQTVADAKFGFLLYHDRFWFGATAPQLLRNRIQLLDDTENLSRMADHYYAMGGYRLPIADDWVLEPSFLLKYVYPVPPKIDLTATIKYRNSVWLGAGFRTNDAWCAMVGYWHKETFQFGYSYDIITSNLRNYSTGTHEIMLAVTIGRGEAPAPVPIP